MKKKYKTNDYDETMGTKTWQNMWILPQSSEQHLH
jgi:hypothetical protein